MDTNNKQNQGWISLYRTIKDHWIFENDKWFKWWVIMLFEVNHAEGKMTLGYDLVAVSPGQSTNSLRTWARLFDTTPKSVMRFFNLLETDGMIAKETIGSGKQSTTLITIENYEQYQSRKETQKGTQGKHERPTNNNDNNNNNKIKWDNLLSSFNRITGKKCRVISDKVKGQFRARLKEGFTKEEFQLAIINCFNDSYHQETDHKFLTLEFISRADKMDKFVSMGKPKKKLKQGATSEPKEGYAEYARKQEALMKQSRV